MPGMCASGKYGLTRWEGLTSSLTSPRLALGFAPALGDIGRLTLSARVISRGRPQRFTSWRHRHVGIERGTGVYPRRVVHRSRGARTEWIPGRLFRYRPRRLRARSAPVRGLGDRGRDATVRDAPGSHRSVRTRTRGARSSASDDRTTVGHDHVLLPVRRTRRTDRTLASGARAPPEAGLRVPRCWTRPQRARGDAR